MNPTFEETIAAMMNARAQLDDVSANSVADAVIAKHGDAYGNHGHLVQIARPLNNALCDRQLRKTGVPAADRLAELIRPEIERRAVDLGGDAATLKAWLDQGDLEAAATGGPDAA